jgi:hypothetical protein
VEAVTKHIEITGPVTTETFDSFRDSIEGHIRQVMEEIPAVKGFVVKTITRIELAVDRESALTDGIEAECRLYQRLPGLVEIDLIDVSDLEHAKGKK